MHVRNLRRCDLRTVKRPARSPLKKPGPLRRTAFAKSQLGQRRIRIGVIACIHSLTRVLIILMMVLDITTLILLSQMS